MDIVQLYQDFSVDFKTEGHKHCRPGWVNTPCPFCTGNPGYHLSYNLQNDFYLCWRCGSHRTIEAVTALLQLPERDVYALVKQYGLLISSSPKTPLVKQAKKEHILPTNVYPIEDSHTQYLIDRNYDPEYICKQWKILGTGPISFLDGFSYKHRIIIPFIWNDQQVSFDSRDITKKVKEKYKACPLDRELIPHKSILYGDQHYWKSTGICVEGPTDVWRFGVRSFATSGIKFTPKQIRVMANMFSRIAVIFDPEPQAIVQANKLVGELKFRGVDAFRVDIKSDPGDLPQSEADYIVKQLIT